MAYQLEDLKRLVRTIPDFPKPKIQFRDLTTLFLDASGFRATVEAMAAPYREQKINRVVGIESRGFILGAPIALELGVGFVPLRKPGKLPGATVGIEYELEYGTDRIEIHRDALEGAPRILLVDDLLATGGTLRAACSLVEQVGSQVAGIALVAELVDLQGRQQLSQYPIHRLMVFKGE